MEQLSSKLKELMAKKESIETDIQEFNAVLISQENVGMSGSLLDEDQYPRSDIDIYKVRHARNKILCLQNDRKSLMKEIETCLHELHKFHLVNKKGDHERKTENVGQSVHSEAFASIGKVDPNSPADIGGLMAGDQIVEFGSLNKSNFSSLEDISRITRYNKGQPLKLAIKREGDLLHLSLVPNTWSGPGILGCTILPIQK